MHFPEIFLFILDLILLKFVSKGLFGNKSALVQVMDWHQIGNKSLFNWTNVDEVAIWHHEATVS